MNGEKHHVEVEDQKVAAIERKSDSGKYLFVCHGFGGHKERQQDYFQPGVENGFNVVGLDFRGNGESEGEFIKTDLSSRIRDLEAVIDHFDPEEYYLFGTSFGGRVAFEVAAERKPDGIVLKSPVTFNSVMEEFRNVVEEKGEFEYIDGKPIDHRFFQDLDSYSFEKTAQDIECPVAIFHGIEDATVHPEKSIRAMNHFETDAMLQLLEGEKHSFSEEAKQKMLERMFSWLEDVRWAAQI